MSYLNLHSVLITTSLLETQCLNRRIARKLKVLKVFKKWFILGKLVMSAFFLELVKTRKLKHFMDSTDWC